MNDWRTDLEQLFAAADAMQQGREDQPPERPEVSRFFTEVVLPAFREVQQVMEQHGRTAEVSSYLGDAEHASATIIVSKGSERKIDYSVRVDVYPHQVVPYAETRAWSRTGQAYSVKGAIRIRSGLQHESMQDLTKDDIERNFVDHYTPMLRHQLDAARA